MRTLLVLLASCGYSLTAAERAPKGFTRFYVNQAMDAGTDLGPAATLTRVLRQRVAASRAASLVALDQAEGVLEGRIDAIVDSASVTATPGQQQVSVPAYLARLSGSLRLVDGSGTVVWTSGRVDADETYLAGNAAGRLAVVETAVSITESNRRRALERAAERLANDLYARLMEGF